MPMSGGIFRAVLLTACTALAAAADYQTFAIYGDWGRVAGQGGTAWHKKYYNPNEADACPKHTYDPFYVAITPAEAALAGDGPYIKKPNDPCVVKTCASFQGDHRENCEGAIQQQQSAWHLNRVCKSRGCQFIINTSDNFYNNGCNSTNNANSGANCASRFQTDWADVYKTSYTPAIQHLRWYSSLGNHDILGGIEGVNEQIAYTYKNKAWYMPGRWYAKTIGSGATAINLITIHTSPLIDAYLQPSSSYYANEVIKYGSAKQRAAQLKFVESALKAASKKPGWTIVLGHHPGFGGSTDYFQDNFSGLPESSAWGKLAALVKKYKPIAYVNGHDHVIDFAAPAGYHTNFIVSGAGSFTEPGDGGWNTSTGAVSAYKPALKYSNVRMSDGGSYTGSVVAHVTATTFRVRLEGAEFFSIRSGSKSEYLLSCKKTGSSSSPYTCTHGHGQVMATYSKA